MGIEGTRTPSVRTLAGTNTLQTADRKAPEPKDNGQAISDALKGARDSGKPHGIGDIPTIHGKRIHGLEDFLNGGRDDAATAVKKEGKRVSKSVDAAKKAFKNGNNEKGENATRASYNGITRAQQKLADYERSLQAQLDRDRTLLISRDHSADFAKIAQMNEQIANMREQYETLRGKPGFIEPPVWEPSDIGSSYGGIELAGGKAVPSDTAPGQQVNPKAIAL